MKLKAPGDLLRQASKSKDLFIGVINNNSTIIKEPETVPLNVSKESINKDKEKEKEKEKDKEERKIFKRGDTANSTHKTSKPLVSWGDKGDKGDKGEKADRVLKERSRSKDQNDPLERGDKEARRERETQRKKDLENSRALALKKLSEASVVSPRDHEVSDIHDDDNESTDYSQDPEASKKLKNSKRRPKAKRISDKSEKQLPVITPRNRDEPDTLNPRDHPARDFIALKKSKSIRDIFFNAQRVSAEPVPEPQSHIHQAQPHDSFDTIRDRFLKSKRNSKKSIEVGLIFSKSADAVPEFGCTLPALPSLPSIEPYTPLSPREEEIEDDSDDEEDNETVPETSKLNLDDILNTHILGGSSPCCQTCRNPIPEGTSSILFQNRRYHLKCYVCYHCHCSLLEVVPHMEKYLLMCEDCHYALF